MSESNKLTKKDFKIMEPDEYYWENGNVLCMKLPDDDQNGEQTIQQILKNQENAKMNNKILQENKQLKNKLKKNTKPSKTKTIQRLCE